jgi:hypothetical protein
MHQNYQKYKKINTDRYKKGIKNSFYSLISIVIGLLFTYLAMTNPTEDNKNTKHKKNIKNNVKIEEKEDYSYVSVRRTIDEPKLTPPQEKKDK